MCTTWLIVQTKLLSARCLARTARVSSLEAQLIALARDHAPNRILIEQAGPGLHLIQEFRANPVPGVPMPIGIKPAGDKLVRMEAQCARFEAGQVLPAEGGTLAQ